MCTYDDIYIYGMIIYMYIWWYVYIWNDPHLDDILNGFDVDSMLYMICYDGMCMIFYVYITLPSLAHSQRRTPYMKFCMFI